MFADVTHDMRIAREEIFGPVLGVFKWRDEADDAGRGQRGRIRPDRLDLDQRSQRPRTAPPWRWKPAIVWINEVGKHFLGAPFGGFKQSGFGREECFEEMLSFTQEKNIHVKLRPAKTLSRILRSFPRKRESTGQGRSMTGRPAARLTGSNPHSIHTLRLSGAIRKR